VINYIIHLCNVNPDTLQTALSVVASVCDGVEHLIRVCCR